MERVAYTDEEVHSLIQSMCAPLANKVKLLMAYPIKNKQLAQNLHLIALVDLIHEQLIPQFCMLNLRNFEKLNEMHNLCYLLAMKAQAVFTSGVIRTCIDQNWDLKGFRAVLIRILRLFEVEENEKRLTTMFDKLIQSQNLQSQACIKAIAYFLKNSKKKIEEDDLRNPIQTYSTAFAFVRDDIQHFRNQNMKPNCFSVLHPWAYDLDTVDFKYIVNRDLVSEVGKHLTTREAKVFWFTFFKSQLSASADEFFQSLRELCEMNFVPEYFTNKFEEFKKFMVSCDYVLNVQNHKEFIEQFIQDFQEYALKHHGFSVLKDQIRREGGIRDQTEYIDESKIKVYSVYDTPDFNVLSIGNLKNMSIHVLNETQKRQRLSLARHTIEVKAPKQISQKIQFKFTNVDTEELQGTEIDFAGTTGYFKVGEGDMNHYQILNDKKLWESQFMIVNKDGQYYIRDLGIVHTSRIKVDRGLEVQLQKGTVVDMGKVIHYHFDKVTQRHQPQTQSQKNFLVMRPHVPYVVEEEDPVLRGRPTWVSQDESKEMIQNEILISVEDTKTAFSVGRSVKRDIEIKLKAVSADHCQIVYSDSKGWVIHENGKERPSSNGTFVFMKSQNQMDDHEPSDMIPLYDGMILSFINYELHVKITNKNQEEMQQEASLTQDQDQPAQPHGGFDQTMPQHMASDLKQEEIDPRKHYIEAKKDEYMKQLHAVQDPNEPEKVVKQPNLEQFPDIDEEKYAQELREKQQREEEERKKKELEEEHIRQQAAEEARREKEEQEQREAAEKKHKEEEEERKRQAEEAEKQRIAAEEAEKKKQQEEAERVKAEEEARHKAEEAKKKADEEARLKKEEEERIAHEQEQARLAQQKLEEEQKATEHKTTTEESSPVKHAEEHKEEVHHSEPHHEASPHKETHHEEPKHEEPKHEEPKHEEPKHEEPHHEEPKQEETKHEEPKHEETTHEESKHDSPAKTHHEEPKEEHHSPVHEEKHETSPQKVESHHVEEAKHSEEVKHAEHTEHAEPHKDEHHETQHHETPHSEAAKAEEQNQPAAVQEVHAEHHQEQTSQPENQDPPHHG